MSDRTARLFPGLALLVAVAVTGCARTAPLHLEPPPVRASGTADTAPDVRAPVARTGALALRQAVALALDAHPALVAARAEAEAARVAIGHDPELRDPLLRLDYGESDAVRQRGLLLVDEPSETMAASLRVYTRQPLEAHRNREGRVAAHAAAAAAVAALERDVVSDVLLVFADLRHAYTERRLRGDLLAARKQSLDAQSSLRAAGQATALDTADAEFESLDAEYDLQRAESGIRDALDRLTALTGEDMSGRRPSFEGMPDLTPLVALGRANVSEMVRVHPARAVHAARIDAARAAWRVARHAWMPWPSYIQGTWREENGVGPEEEEEWSVRAAVDVPLVSWISSEAPARHVDYELAVNRLAAFDRQSVAAVHSRFTTAEEALRAWNTLARKSDPTLRDLERILADMPEAQRDGLVGTRVRALLARALRTRSAAYRACEQALIELARAVGVDPRGYMRPAAR